MRSGCHRAMVGLGGNLNGPLGGPADYFETALDRLSSIEGVDAIRASSFYRSSPWGNTRQGDFLNAVADVACELDPQALLATLIGLEKELGRKRGERWGPRIIDLDLLTFDALELDSEYLVLPHPRMHERAFVLVPLLELDPDFIIPGHGRADACLRTLGDDQKVEPV